MFMIGAKKTLEFIYLANTQEGTFEQSNLLFFMLIIPGKDGFSQKKCIKQKWPLITQLVSEISKRVLNLDFKDLTHALKKCRY